MDDNRTPVTGKGLKKDALSFLSTIAIGVSSTSPAYSLAATLGPIAAFAGDGTPGIMAVAFLPMLCIAVACFHMNRADPDCGTTFSWVTRAFGPHAGWMGGWSIIVTDILVMPNLAAIAGAYSFQLFGISEPSTLAVTITGVVWIALMTGLCYAGIEPSARTQRILTGAELAILVIFAVVALGEAHGANPPAGSRHVAAAWLNPFTTNFSDFTEAMVLAVFIYWGWDCSVAVNEETRQPGIVPGRAAIASTIVLLAIYVLVAIAAVSVAGPDFLAKNKDDVLAPIGQQVLGSSLDRLLILVVLISAVASTQTTILPTARMALSMASAGAIPPRFGTIDARYLTPGFATLAMGAVSIVWYVGLTLVSTDLLTDSLTALGLIIAFYYALTGFACVVFYRRQIVRSIRDFLFKGLIPGVGGICMFALFIKACAFPGAPDDVKLSVMGIGGPVVIGIGALIVGFIMMLLARYRYTDFFRRRPETARDDDLARY